ncbi:TonB-dependent receptor [Hymenobacter sp. BT770]|uniref:TonB-dependent receptor n=1 Tax=Hymenobacter sp. BT770 TaxID=2886942 RepID=UPI001D10A17F|nr:TonB-dependent receptor [Hymenobacter sp. BT770]MCC3151973.1 TonB-dependent receptor [Hymenobacter sp. BT770]MDO3417083.1 TonB-dependent receptor [Hymenobacter sp. BT770]
MKHFFTVLFAVLLTLPAVAQSTFSIRGRVLDKVTGETLPGATVQVTGNGQNTGGGADTDGAYKIPGLAAGSYTVQASFVGYKPSTQVVKITTQSVVVSFALASDNASLGEVQVVASQAQERQTPVAFSAVNEVKLRETLSNRDLPMILNETPGVYATQSGGGTGDSRINVRGFDQRNVAVLINGVPVNDMENGNVFWSNWDLGDVTKSLQVQRGLSASKIAVPSVGGTINVLTKGFDDKRSVLARLETGSNNYRKASLLLSSGQLKGDWAFTFYGSRRTSDGWVDKTFDDAWTYFGTVSKRAGKHSLSLTGLGSPQQHGQRSFPSFVSTYSYAKAREIGVSEGRLDKNGDRGFQYNPYWGTLDRYTLDGNGQKISHGQEVLNERTNFYHKPQINFNDMWQVNEKLFISTVLYASYGTGGGSSTLTGTSTTNTVVDPNTGQTDFQKIYDNNYRAVGTDGQRKSSEILVNAVNSHRWYGSVIGADYLINDKFTLSAGLDGRNYTGLHYREVRDLLGGDYTVAASGGRNLNTDASTRLHVGDKLGYNYDGKTQWVGGYSQLEYKTPLLSAVVSGTLSRVSYKRIDYFQKQQADGSPVETDWTRFNGYSVKAGANYNLTEHDNIFANIGYNSKVPFFNLLYNNSGRKYDNVKPEGISSAEIGYGISYPTLKVTLNAYYTLWANKTTTSFSTATGDAIYSNVRNVNARHTGVELSVAQEISRRLQLNSAISLGDWRWTGKGLLNQTFEDGSPATSEVDVPVYLDGVHVGDAAQNQFQIGLRYEPFRGAYIRPSYLIFTKYYAAFNPETIRDQATSTDSYRLPTSRNLDIHMGYDFKPLINEKVRFGVKASVLNVLNEFYFTDVSNRAASNTGSLDLLQAFFNRGRTFTVGLSATL